jgi:hypothetical protein
MHIPLINEARRSHRPICFSATMGIVDMQHIRDIATDRSKSDLRWNSAKTLADCNAYMAIEAQRAGAIGFEYIRRPEHAVKGPNWLRGAMDRVTSHYDYARSIMGIVDADQYYS